VNIGAWVWTTCLGLLGDSGMTRIKLEVCRSLFPCPVYCATTPRCYILLNFVAGFVLLFSAVITAFASHESASIAFHSLILRQCRRWPYVICFAHIVSLHYLVLSSLKSAGSFKLASGALQIGFIIIIITNPTYWNKPWVCLSVNRYVFVRLYRLLNIVVWKDAEYAMKTIY